MAMNNDDIIRMAERAGMERCKCEPRCHLHTGGMGSLTYFAKLVAEAEREECAKFIEDEYVRQFEEPWRQNLAKTIRARGQA